MKKISKFSMINGGDIARTQRLPGIAILKIFEKDDMSSDAVGTDDWTGLRHNIPLVLNRLSQIETLTLQK